MNDILQRQCYAQFAIWEEMRQAARDKSRKPAPECVYERPSGAGKDLIKCNKCKQYHPVETMRRRFYGQKSVRYCPDCW